MRKSSWIFNQFDVPLCLRLLTNFIGISAINLLSLTKFAEARHFKKTSKILLAVTLPSSYFFCNADEKGKKGTVYSLSLIFINICFLYISISEYSIRIPYLSLIIEVKGLGGSRGSYAYSIYMLSGN